MNIQKLATELATGAITSDYIKVHYGVGVLSAVLGIGHRIVAGATMEYVMDQLHKDAESVDFHKRTSDNK